MAPALSLSSLHPSKSMLAIFGLGSSGIRKIEEKKQKHTWAVQILNELLKYSSLYEYDYTTGTNPLPATPKKDVETTMPYDIGDGGTVNFAPEDLFLWDLKPKTPTADTLETKEEEKNIGTGGNDKTKEEKKQKEHIDTPILIAAKNGISELVKKTLKSFPVAMHDLDQHKMNIVLLAVEHKQPHVYELLLSLKKKNVIRESIFFEVDSEGNSALHLAAKKANFIWPIPGAASQMQWEIKWFEYIKKSMQERFLLLPNKKGKTPEEVFTEEHVDVVKEGGQWLSNISNSCLVVAGLFVTVTFSMSSTVPDSVKQVNKDNQESIILAGSSFVSFCSSLIAVVMFLAILTSGYREKDFRYSLLRKLLLGLTVFHVSIASTLICFCCGHFFVFKGELKSAVSSSYLVVCLLLITFFAFAQLQLYVHLLWATFKKVPQRNYRFSFPR